jgi:hypothetical protein
VYSRVSLEAAQKAKRALSAFRAMQPTLNAYARMLTGKPNISVVDAAFNNGSTDGHKIYYRPPIGLGEQLPHQHWACDKRNPEGLQTCPACAQRESVLTTVYHEIAHIWFDSFSPADEKDQAHALREAIREHGSKYADKLRDEIARAPYSVRTSYMALANLISPYLPRIINALEDARVNRALFHAMPGTKIMFDADTVKILKTGVEQLDRSGNWGLQTWDTYPLNAQIVCGLFCKSSGYSYAEWFHEDVVAALDDEKLTDLVNKNNVADSVADVYGLAFPILARLRELGFCRSEHDPEDEEEPPPPMSNEEDDDGGSGGDSEDDSTPDSGGESPSEEASSESGGTEGDGVSESSSVPEGDDRRPDESEDAGRDESPGSDGDPEPDDGDESGLGSEGDQGEADPDGQREEASGGDSTPPSEPEVGDVDDDSEGPEAGDSSAQGSSGGSDEDDDLDSGSGLPNERRGNDPGREEDLGEAPDHSSESGSSAPSEGEDQGDESAGEDSEAEGTEPGGDSDASSLGDGDDDLGGPDRLDPLEGEDLWPESSDTTERSSGDGPDDDEERIDTGPFTRGTRLIVDEDEEKEKPKKERPEMGTAEDVDVALLKMGDHEPPAEMYGHSHDDDEDIEAMRLAIVQGMYFETPSVNIVGVQHYDFPEVLYSVGPESVPDIADQTGQAWHYGWLRDPDLYVRFGIKEGADDSFDPPLEVLTEATLKARIAFADNMRGGYTVNHKSGRVNPRHLGKRAPVDDPRLMRRKLKPSKKSYFVVVGIDVSGSTIGENIYLAKKIAMAECEMLNDLGIKFAVYAHSGGSHSLAPETGIDGMYLHIYNVKAPDEPWTDRTRYKLKSLGADSANLDGHTFEYYRHILESQRETTKILHYYSDGAMPAENHDEELSILQREIQTYKRKGHIVLGVGVRSDAPRQHGLETVEVHEVSHIMKVIAHLERELTKR